MHNVFGQRICYTVVATCKWSNYSKLKKEPIFFISEVVRWFFFRSPPNREKCSKFELLVMIPNDTALPRVHNYFVVIFFLLFLRKVYVPVFAWGGRFVSMHLLAILTYFTKHMQASAYCTSLATKAKLKVCRLHANTQTHIHSMSSDTTVRKVQASEWASERTKARAWKRDKERRRARARMKKENKQKTCTFVELSLMGQG